jgi:hypothetical protein
MQKHIKSKTAPATLQDSSLQVVNNVSKLCGSAISIMVSQA